MRLGSIFIKPCTMCCTSGRLADGGPGFGDCGGPVEVPNGQLDGGPNVLKQGWVD